MTNIVEPDSPLLEQIIEGLTLALRAYPDVKIARLYGSAGRGRLRLHSDIDVAVAAHGPLEDKVYANLKGDLSDAMRRDIDLVDLQVVSGVILCEALTTGRVLFVDDKMLYARIITRMLFNQADMMPYYRRILQERREAFLR